MECWQAIRCTHEKPSHPRFCCADLLFNPTRRLSSFCPLSFGDAHHQRKYQLTIKVEHIRCSLLCRSKDNTGGQRVWTGQRSAGKGFQLSSSSAAAA